MHVGGTINTGNHFRAWASVGLKLGTQLYMDMVIEGQQGGGNATITVGTPPSTSVPNTPTPTRRTQKAAGHCPYTRPVTTTKSSSTKETTTTTTPMTTTTTKAPTSTAPVPAVPATTAATAS